ncbi:MAG TPA: delta-60 repeat domain-containing protein, partial [Candidatus Limnocylindria bacterium]|nr:delta-60 repeat domain-containing protein [Candidatus Limnocylindria bacterium]
MNLSFWYVLVTVLTASPEAVFSEGDLDAAFGTGGMQIIGSSQGSSFGVTPPLVQADGKIVVCGSGLSTDGTHFAGFVYRLNPDGSPDVQFGESGRVELATNFIAPPCTAWVLQRDEKIVLAMINGIDATVPITDEE